MNTEPKSYISYLRVSTDKQGVSGLGLEAQRAAVTAHVGAAAILSEYVEVESGRSAKRPQLAAALAKAKNAGASLVVAKLDRLSRNAHFLLGLVESGVDVMFCDLPQMAGPIGKFMLTQMAAIAELEAGLIGQRTKAALAAAKERGRALGSLANGQHQRNHEDALKVAEEMRPFYEQAYRKGYSYQSTASYFNDLGLAGPRGGRWGASSVYRLVRRLEQAAA